MRETTRVAGTIETSWPKIEAFLRIGVTNGRTKATTG
jgi:hypothetical protein